MTKDRRLELALLQTSPYTHGCFETGCRMRLEIHMLELLDYRRRVAELYTTIRQLGTGSAEAFAHFQKVRNRLFAEHPSSPLSDEQKATFNGLLYLPYDPRFRVTAAVTPVTDEVIYKDEHVEEGTFHMRSFGTVDFELPTGRGRLTLYWILGYGGGVFLPFRDASSGKTTYGGGRYLLDTIKGADLGTEDGRIILDFNYAYHPSCTYHPRWICPLALAENRLSFAVPVGEQLPENGY
jgi:uncharacterized protein (DUF1684 family)